MVETVDSKLSCMWTLTAYDGVDTVQHCDPWCMLIEANRAVYMSPSHVETAVVECVKLMGTTLPVSSDSCKMATHEFRNL